jgi:hypothetical protein
MWSECRNWSRLTDAEKTEAIEKAVAIHCDALGMPDRMPKIKIIERDRVKIRNEDYQITNGLYNPVEHEISVNRKSAGWADDFESLLNTIVHENTHNYQYMLMNSYSGLDLTAVTAADPLRFQVSMFMLNDGPGYVMGGSPGSTPDEDAVYRVQPMERHAWLAGGEVTGLFQEAAQNEVSRLMSALEEMTAALPPQKPPSEDRKALVKAMASHLDQLVRAQLMKITTRELIAILDSAQAFLDSQSSPKN